MKKVRELMEDFRSGKIELGKELTTSVLSLFSNDFNRNTEKFVKNRNKYVIEVMSRPIDPLTTNFLNAVSHSNTVEGMKKLLVFMKNYLKNSRKEMIPHGKSLLEKKETIMVIGFSKTMAEMINSHTPKLTVYVPEIIPTNAGRQMVKALSGNAILIPDSAMGYFMPSINAVISRSCCVSTEGLLSTIGAKSAAITAKWYNKPFYMVAELLRCGENFVVTEKKWDRPFSNRAPLYDQLEPELVSGIINEEGILTHEKYIDRANTKKEEMM